MADINVPNTATVGRELGGEQLTQLFNGERTILVPDSQVESFITDGWERDAIDPATAVSEVRVLADAFVKALGDLIDEVGEQGEVDPDKALAVTQTAFVELGGKAGAVLQSLQRRYPVKQGKGVVMHRGEGDERESGEVDPGQVDLFLEAGWTKGK